uniref:DUF8018 domain-containing protein n=1 Tax=Solanum lycopersicum TaxID=4081 RepID=A0A3Q7J6Y2_SOLLC
MVMGFLFLVSVDHFLFWDLPATETSTSVDQPEIEPRHVDLAIQVAPCGNEVRPSNQPPRVSVYQVEIPNQYSYIPPIEIMYLDKIEAKDLFEVKVQILRIMEVLDPTEDCLGRGFLDKLHTLLSDLESSRVNYDRVLFSRQRIDKSNGGRILFFRISNRVESTISVDYLR